MSDIFSKEKRSEIMRNVKGRNTKPEIVVRKYLFKNGLRFRIHCKDLPGSPDIVLKKYKTIIFVNGCFWHGHTLCKYARLPKSRVDFWKQKIERNIARDIKNTDLLKTLGWRVIAVYECDLKPNKFESFMSKLVQQLILRD